MGTFGTVCTLSEIGEYLDDVDLKVRLRSKEWSEEEIVIQSALKRVTGKYTHGSMVECLGKPPQKWSIMRDILLGTLLS